MTNIVVHKDGSADVLKVQGSPGSCFFSRKWVSKKSIRVHEITLFLDLLKMICYFLHGKSTSWGIYREYVLFFGGSLSKSMYFVINL